jgi:membrane-associated phospholipid phosphatase
MSILFQQFQLNFTLFMQGLGGWLLPFMMFFTSLGSEYAFLLILPLIYWCIDSAIGLRTAVMLTFSVSSHSILKLVFHTPRPYWVDARVKAFSAETSFGFPSGHSTDAVSVWGTVARGFNKRWLTLTLVFIMFMIGLSRIYLGVHFLQDVLGGWLLGGLLLLGLSLLDKPVTRWLGSKSLTVQILVSACVSGVILLLGILARNASTAFVIPPDWITQAFNSSQVSLNPRSLDGLVTVSGLFFGFGAGYAWLTKKLHGYQVEGSFEKRVLRFLVGLITVVIVYLPLELIAPSQPEALSLIVTYLRYALLGLWVSAGAPLLFRRLKLDR